jgi:hypothetical protein
VAVITLGPNGLGASGRCSYLAQREANPYLVFSALITGIQKSQHTLEMVNIFSEMYPIAAEAACPQTLANTPFRRKSSLQMKMVT